MNIVLGHISLLLTHTHYSPSQTVSQFHCILKVSETLLNWQVNNIH